MNFEILKLAFSNFRGVIADYAFFKYNLDFTYPTQIYVETNTSCNSKCLMCDNWRIQHLNDDLAASIWINALKELKSINRNLIVCFAGGEVLLKKDIFDIFKFCNENDICFTITTNGKLLNQNNVKKLFELEPFNINISLDSLNPIIYHEIRGIDSLEQVKANIKFIVKYKKKVKSKTMLNLKTIVCNKNLNEIEEIVKYSHETGFNSITLQPIFKTTKEAKEMFRIDKQHLNYVINKLITMKKDGYIIANSVENILNWMNYFDEGHHNKSYQCTVPLKSVYIRADGNMYFCEWHRISIGNIKKQNVRELLSSKKTRVLKKKLAYCKKPCVYCIQRTIRDYIKIFYNYLKN